MTYIHKRDVLSQEETSVVSFHATSSSIDYLSWLEGILFRWMVFLSWWLWRNDYEAQIFLWQINNAPAIYLHKKCLTRKDIFPVLCLILRISHTFSCKNCFQFFCAYHHHHSLNFRNRKKKLSVNGWSRGRGKNRP